MCHSRQIDDILLIILIYIDITLRKNPGRIVAICNAIFGYKDILFNIKRLYDIAQKNILLQIVTPIDFLCAPRKIIAWDCRI
jgi:hypothetical protein